MSDNTHNPNENAEQDNFTETDMQAETPENTNQNATQSTQASKRVGGAFSISFSRFVVIIWCLLSVPFVAYVAWAYLQGQVYQAGVQTGTRDTANGIYKDIIAKAANEQCNTIFVTYENKRVDLVNVRCLEQAQQQQDATLEQ